jgi:tRNA nucleotidyltransferase (CCA-adding enzyme)
MSQIETPQNLIKLAKMLSQPLYLTGGYVRNSLLGLDKGDIDICSALAPWEVAGLIEGTPFEVVASYNQLGTLKIRAGSENYEYTAFRRDYYGEGGSHKPEKVELCSSLEEDAKRRDFTVNAIYYDILGEKTLDPLGGLEDLKKRLVRAHDPELIFRSDALRLLRMVRFACELGFDIDEDTYAAAAKYANQLKDIVPERIFDEFYRILLSDTRYSNPGFPHYRGLHLLKDLGLLPLILPGIELCYGVPQRSDFHRYDVFEHIAQTVKFSHPSVRLAAALHDIGKGICHRAQGNAYGHEIVGAEMAERILGRQGLKCPKKLVDEMVFLVRYHMYDLKNQTSENKVRMFIVRNFPLICKLMLLKQADFLGCGKESGLNPTVKRWQTILEKMRLEKAPFSLRELEVDGRNMLGLGCPPTQISKVLDKLLEDCVYKPSFNKRELLLERAKKYIDAASKGRL